MRKLYLKQILILPILRKTYYPLRFGSEWIINKKMEKINWFKDQVKHMQIDHMSNQNNNLQLMKYGLIMLVLKKMEIKLRKMDVYI